MSSFTIDKVRFKHLQKTLRKMTESFGDMKKPLIKSAQIINYEYHDNFAKQGFNYGKAWAPLAESTVRQRIALGYPGRRPILKRTGKLEKGLRTMLPKKESIELVNKVEYAAVHQFGSQRKRIPQRKFLSSSKKSRKAILIVFANYLMGRLIGAAKS